MDFQNYKQPSRRSATRSSSTTTSPFFFCPRPLALVFFLLLDANRSAFKYIEKMNSRRIHTLCWQLIRLVWKSLRLVDYVDDLRGQLRSFCSLCAERTYTLGTGCFFHHVRNAIYDGRRLYSWKKWACAGRFSLSQLEAKHSGARWFDFVFCLFLAGNK